MESNSFGSRVKSTAKKVGVIAIVAIVVVGFAVFSFYYWGTYDEGVRAGMVLRISKKGMIFKTYEGQLDIQAFGALKNTSPVMQAFDFSVEPGNEKVIEDLQSAALSGERVNLHYIKRYKVFPWRGDTKYFITSVERLGK